MDSAKLRDISNLKNWLSDTGCISQKETAFLDHNTDLTTAGTLNIDSALNSLEAPLVDVLIWLSKKIKVLGNFVGSLDV
jgi:hypothetical protein